MCISDVSLINWSWDIILISIKNIILKTAIINNNNLLYPFPVNVIIELLMTATY